MKFLRIRICQRLISRQKGTVFTRSVEEDFHIPMTREIEEEVSEMCNLGYAVENVGVERGLLISIKNLMDSMKWTAGQAMDALKIPKEDQKKYEDKL